MVRDHLKKWLHSQAGELESRGLMAGVTTRSDDRGKGASWIDLDSDERLGRLIIWDSGEATLSVADVVSGEMLTEENLEISSTFGLEQALASLIGWLDGRQK